MTLNLHLPLLLGVDARNHANYREILKQLGWDGVFKQVLFVSCFFSRVEELILSPLESIVIFSDDDFLVPFITETKRIVFSFHETILTFGDWIPRVNLKGGPTVESTPQKFDKEIDTKR